MIYKRINLVKVKNIESIYFYQKGIKKNKRIDVSKFGEGSLITPDFRDALLKLKEIVEANEGNLYVIDLFRSWETQQNARREYEQGKKPFVAKPGGSFHNAGRAVDFDTKNLNFKNIPKDRWLEKFWDISKPLGFKPIIKIPDLDIPENWHFDFPGQDWNFAYKKLSYPEIAKCCILDAGLWKGDSEIKTRNMFIQSQLVRLEFFEIGKVDGIIGSKTRNALNSLGLSDIDLEFTANQLIKY